MEMLPFIIVIIIFPIIWYVQAKVKKAGEAEAEEAVKIIIDDSLFISPYVKESLNGFSIEHASQLRTMQPQELAELLSCCSKALKIFEKRVEQISNAYEQYEIAIDNRPAMVKRIENNASPLAKKIYGHNVSAEMNRKRLAPMKAKLDSQVEQVIAIFDKDLKAEGSVLNIIPEKYRLSSILDMMCGYLSDGEVDSWEGCIRTYKEDSHKMRMEEYSQAFIESLNRIERNTSKIAFYSAVTAFNVL